MRKYKVKKNETLVKIAIDNGFKTTESILKANEERWPHLTMHQHALMEGMEIFIPDKETKEVNQSTGTKVIYKATRKAEQHLSLKIEDRYNEIKSVKDDVQLIINGGKVPIIDKTDYESIPVEYKTISTLDPLPDGEIKDSKLKMKLTSVLTGEFYEQEIILVVGGIDPIIDPLVQSYTGQESNSKSMKIAIQKILINLGYDIGEIDGDLEKPISKIAISRFQSDHMLLNPSDEDYGFPSLRTCIYLGLKLGVDLGPIQRLVQAD